MREARAEKSAKFIEGHLALALNLRNSFKRK